MSRFYKVKGCVHIHFPIKLEEKVIKKIAESGNKTNLDFLVLTSHVPEKKGDKYEKLLDFHTYYGKTLIISGQETNDTKKKNHLIIVGEKKWHKKREKIEEIIARTKESSLKIVAHPFGSHKLFLKRKDYQWENWNDKFDCVEIWSLLFDWASDTTIFNLPYRYLGFPNNLKGPDGKTLQMWDTLLQNRKISGLAGLDIHMLFPFLKILDFKKNFTYEKCFKTLRNHLFLREPLTGNPASDMEKIINCMKKGNFYFANDFLKNSEGFYFGEENGSFIMGDRAILGKRIIVEVPFSGEIRIIENGKLIYRQTGNFFSFMVKKKAIYRVEVLLNNKSWIFSNPVYF